MPANAPAGQWFGQDGSMAGAPVHLADEAIADGVHGDDVARMERRITQGATQLRDRVAQYTRCDAAAAPCRIEQRIFVDHVARLLQQRQQHRIDLGLHGLCLTVTFQQVCGWIDDDAIALV